MDKLYPSPQHLEPALSGEAARPAYVARRPFEPPLVLWTEPFQPVAYGMACGKISGISEKCNSFPQLS